MKDHSSFHDPRCLTSCDALRAAVRRRSCVEFFRRAPQCCLAIITAQATFVTLVIAALVLFKSWAKFTSPTSYPDSPRFAGLASYPSPHKIWEPYGVYTALLSELHGKILTDSLNCPLLHSKPTCNARKKQPNATMPRRSVRFRSPEDNPSVKLAFAKHCTASVEAVMMLLAQALTWQPTPDSVPSPPKPDWPLKDERFFYKMIRDVLDVMEDNDIDHFVAYGSLIGIARHGGLVPWDTKDIDIVLVDRDGTQKRKLIQVLRDNGFLIDCHWNGILLSIHREDVMNCSASNRFPKLDIWTAFPVPFNQNMYYLHATPRRCVIPRNLLQPLRLAYLHDELDGEFSVLKRAMSDGVLDCSGEYAGSSIQDEKIIGNSWRDICYDEHDGVSRNCSDLVDKMGFVKTASLSLADFAHRYAPEAERAVLSGPLPPDMKVHVTWQHYKGKVVHFWLDFAYTPELSGLDCAVMLSAPRSEPRAVKVEAEESRWSWELGHAKQCIFEKPKT